MWIVCCTIQKICNFDAARRNLYSIIVYDFLNQHAQVQINVYRGWLMLRTSTTNDYYVYKWRLFPLELVSAFLWGISTCSCSSSSTCQCYWDYNDDDENDHKADSRENCQSEANTSILTGTFTSWTGKSLQEGHRKKGCITMYGSTTTYIIYIGFQELKLV